eukprot:gene34496-biopygen31999
MEPKGALCTALGLGKHNLKRDVLKALIARVRYFTADEDSNMIAAPNDPTLMPEWLRPVDKLSDPNHMQTIQYKLLEALMRTSEKWKGGTLSKAVIDYLNRLYCYVIKSVAGKECLEWAFPDDEKAEWLRGAVLNVVDHAFGKHENCGNEPPGYYEKVMGVFEARLAKKEVLMKQLHDTDTNSNESYNSMVNEGTGYRRELCSRLGIDPPESMYALDERVQRQKDKAAAWRVTHEGKKKRRLVRDAKSTRNDPLDARFGYASQVGFGHDSRGQVLDDSED